MKRVRFAVFVGALAWAAFGITPAPAVAQDEGAAVASAGAWPDADPEDVATMDAIIAALYDVISGPASEKRDWDRFRSLHIPGARLIPTGQGEDGGMGHRVMGPDDYAASSGPFLEERGFFEGEIARTVQRFGQIAHAFSTYESRWSADDEEPFARGINSIQLFDDGERWWIVTIFWAAERQDLPIPDRYMTTPGEAR